jgi:deoxycytidylate deaminase
MTFDLPTINVLPWRKHFAYVYQLAAKSTDRSTHNGAIILDEIGEIAVGGFNHHLKGYGDEESHHERPLKYSVTEHAERDVILQAAALNEPTYFRTMVANWVVCPDCARAIVIAGIKWVVCHKQCMDRTPERWAEMVQLGLDMLIKNDVQVIQWDGVVGGIENLNNGEIWTP